MNTTDAQDLGLLLRCALEPRRRPATDAEYRRVVDRLRREAAFAEAFDGLCDGLGLLPLAADDYGVVLGVRDDSPFAMRLNDFRVGMKQDDRMVYGLVLLAAAAWCWPRAAELDAFGEGVRRVSVVELTDYLSDLAGRLAEQATRDADADHPELRQAWRAVQRMAPTKATADGRRTATTLAGMVKYALEQLADRGLLRPDGDEVFRTTRAFRTQVRELAANEAFALVRRALGLEGD